MMKLISNLLFFLVINFFTNNSYATHNSINHVTLAKQISLFNNLEVLSNNISNSETNSFNKSKLLVTPYKINYSSKSKVYTVNDVSTYIVHEEGPLINTDQPFDLAISGEGFFMINTPSGIAYTRNGNFFIANNGNLVNSNGYSVLNAQNGEIAIVDDINKLLIKEDGTINVNGEDIDRLGIVTFTNKQKLKQIGNQLYQLKDNNEVIIADEDGYRVVQGFLEGSNVNRVNELMNLIQVQRDMGITANLLSGYDDLTRSAIGKLGKN